MSASAVRPSDTFHGSAPNAVNGGSPVLGRAGTHRHRTAASITSLSSLYGGTISNSSSSRELSGTGHVLGSPTKGAFWEGQGHLNEAGSTQNPSSYGMDRTQNSHGSSSGVGREYEDIQNRTFCKWLNARLEPQGYPPLKDLGTDFSDGTRLIQLVEILADESLGRYNKAPVLRVQKAENVKQALERIKEMGVYLTNIGPEDIVDGNRKLILGMIWSLVLRFTISEINEEGSHAKEGLLLWCQRKTQSYKEVDVQNFTRSFQDGLALCALIHRHRPDLIDWEKLPKDGSAAVENTTLAFKIAEEHLNVPMLLDVHDVCGKKKPDERSVMTYVAQFFHAFSSKAQEETEARVIHNFVEHMSTLMLAIHDYESRVTNLINAIVHLVLDWESNTPQLPYSALKSSQSLFVEHKQGMKRRWVKERGDVTALLGHIQTKLRTYGLKIYEPGEGLRVMDLDAAWKDLLAAEAHRSRTINAKIRSLKEQLRKKFANLANGFEAEISKLSLALAALEGPLNEQQDTIRKLQKCLKDLARQLEPLEAAQEECIACNVDENDYTVYSYDDLSFEFTQLSSDIVGRKTFIDNQVVARSMTNVTPEQLEEFESAYRAFDKDQSNMLDLDELAGALGSLGISEFNLDDLNVLPGEGVGFEKFIKFLIDRSEDRLTAEKVRSTFRSVGAEKGYMTELDLQRLCLPAASLAFLQNHVPRIEPGLTQEEASMGCFDYEQFLDALLD